MQIRADQEAQTYTIRPMNFGELMLFRRIIEMLEPGDKIEYRGRHGDHEEDDFHLLFGIGGEKQRQEKKLSPNVTVAKRVYVGGIKFRMTGTDKDSRDVLGHMRDMCFFGSGGLTFIETADTDVEGVQELVCFGIPCKVCGAQMIGMSRCEWKTCDACSEVCEHTYKRGAIHGGGVDIGVGEFCTKCGRGKPKEEGEREKSVIEHHLAVEDELGISVHYKDGPTERPRQAVQLGRLARRYAKSKERAATASE